MNSTVRLLLTLALISLLGSPALAQDAAPADATAAPADAAAAPAEAAPTPEAAPAEEAAAPAPEAQQAAPAPAADQAPPADEDKCVFGKLCFGPVLTLGLINPLGIGVHARYGEYLGFGLDYQFLPTVGDKVQVGINLVTIDGRFYPFAGSFFLSGGLAFQSASFSAESTNTAGMKSTVEGSITVPAFKLGLGFMGHDGFVMGIDLALEIPLGGTSVDFDSNAGTAEAKMSEKDIEDAADTFVKLLPVMFQLNLIRIGYLF